MEFKGTKDEIETLIEANISKIPNGDYIGYMWDGKNKVMKIFNRAIGEDAEEDGDKAVKQMKLFIMKKTNKNS